jgi:hypothetical protein
MIRRNPFDAASNAAGVRRSAIEPLYALTAVCAASRAAVGLVMPELNRAVVNLFLEGFSRGLAPGVHAVLL